ncbi:DUF2975 domain-containing protein [Nonomuraea sp. NPDC049421]|uniref:DUF2975 domain-containing protein n=1 Tax=Nonomuraea sp. NPDC049421 TaxID=3155275 RepID=UPI00343CFC64
MAALPSILGRAARRPAVFAGLVAVTGAVTGMVLYSRAGLFGLTYPQVVAQSPGRYGIGLDEPAFTAGVLPGVKAMTGDLHFVDGTPDAGQYILQALTTFPGFVVAAVAFFLLWRLLWRAREGAYLPQVARQVRLLGWWLLVGGLLAPQIEHVAMMALLDTMAANESHHLPREIPVIVPLVGAGLLALASVLRTGVRMRDDLEGTV